METLRFLLGSVLILVLLAMASAAVWAIAIFLNHHSRVPILLSIPLAVVIVALLCALDTKLRVLRRKGWK